MGRVYEPKSQSNPNILTSLRRRMPGSPMSFVQHQRGKTNIGLDEAPDASGS